MVLLGRTRCQLLVDGDREYAHARAHRWQGRVQHTRLHLDRKVGPGELTNVNVRRVCQRRRRRQGLPRSGGTADRSLPAAWLRPAWVGDAANAVGTDSLQIFHGPILDGDVGFVHRDFYPGNLLWSGGHLSGVVDWQAACLRLSSIEPGHCRLNML